MIEKYLSLFSLPSSIAKKSTDNETNLKIDQDNLSDLSFRKEFRVLFIELFHSLKKHCSK